LNKFERKYRRTEFQKSYVSLYRGKFIDHCDFENKEFMFKYNPGNVKEYNEVGDDDCEVESSHYDEYDGEDKDEEVSSGGYGRRRRRRKKKNMDSKNENRFNYNHYGSGGENRRTGIGLSCTCIKYLSLVLSVLLVLFLGYTLFVTNK